MLSQEFKSAVAANNILRTRIMLKDSLVVDPTFRQANEMLAFAKQAMPGLFVPFDGGALESDPEKWDLELMNLELVQLVGNFSETRLLHIKKVISKVMAVEIQRARVQKSPPQQVCQQARSSAVSSNRLNLAARIQEKRREEDIRQEAIRQAVTQADNIIQIAQKLKQKQCAPLSQLDELESAATKLLRAVTVFKAIQK